MRNEKECIIGFDFTDDFVCDGQYCGSKCCQNWGIEIDKVTLRKYRNISDKKIKKEIDEKIFYHSGFKKHVFLLTGDGRCSFLDKDGLCCIQKRIGEEYLSDICASYPRKYIKFPSFMTKTLSLSCPVAARLLLEQNKPLVLVDNLLFSNRKRVIKEKKTSSASLVDKWLDIQCVGINILQNKKLTIRERIINLCMFCDALQELSIRDENICEIDSLLEFFITEKQQFEFATLGKSLPFLMQNFIKDMFTLLNKFLEEKAKIMITSQDEEFIEMLERYFQLKEENCVKKLVKLYEEAEIVYKKYILDKYPLLRENYLVYQWFRTVQPIMADGSITQNISMYIFFYRLQEMLLMLVSARERENLKEKHIVDCISYTSQLMEHQHVYFEVCKDYINENKYSIFDMLKIWLPKL